MSMYELREIVCDKCSKVEYVHLTSLESWVRESGWRWTSRDTHFCPECIQAMDTMVELARV